MRNFATILFVAFCGLIITQAVSAHTTPVHKNHATHAMSRADNAWGSSWLDQDYKDEIWDGSWQEDYIPLYHILPSTCRTQGHGYNPATNSTGGAFDILAADCIGVSQRTAKQYASDLWAYMESAFYNGNLTGGDEVGGYHYLGRCCHLIQDMSTYPHIHPQGITWEPLIGEHQVFEQHEEDIFKDWNWSPTYSPLTPTDTLASEATIYLDSWSTSRLTSTASYSNNNVESFIDLVARVTYFRSTFWGEVVFVLDTVDPWDGQATSTYTTPTTFSDATVDAKENILRTMFGGENVRYVNGWTDDYFEITDIDSDSFTWKSTGDDEWFPCAGDTQDGSYCSGSDPTDQGVRTTGRFHFTQSYDVNPLKYPDNTSFDKSSLGDYISLYSMQVGLRYNAGLLGVAHPSITVQTLPSTLGLEVTVDGANYADSQIFRWPIRSSHSISVTSPQYKSGINCTFKYWSDGGSQTHTINADSEGSYIAYFSYQLPQVPYNPAPANNSMCASLDSDLAWNSSDPDGDTVYYTVYFEKDNPSPGTVIKNHETGASCSLPMLDYDSDYYWQVVVTDDKQGSVVSPIWHFRTTTRTPSITQITPTSGPQKTFMKIEGANFHSSSSVIFANGFSGEILELTDALIYCRVPNGVTSGSIVIRTRCNDSNPQNFTVTDPTTIYVNTNYTPNIENGTTTYPFSAIQRGIDAATTSDEVIVADGTYTGEGNRDIELRKTITVRSSNPTDPNIVAATIIDCQGSASEPHRGFNLHGTSTLNGLTIENGYADYGGGISCQSFNGIIINCIIKNNTADYGGGMCNIGSSPTVTNCIFNSNVSNNQGGGMYISSGSQIMTNCVFNGNVANSHGGGIYGESSTIVITDSMIVSNTSYGTGGGIGGGRLVLSITDSNISGNTSVLGGGGISGGYCDINDCTINENESNGNGGGVSMYGTINSCVISNNTSKGAGGGIFPSVIGYTTITDCNFIGNNAVLGGGIATFLYRATISISHCTFSENSADNGGGMSNWVSSPKVTNCVFTANVADTYGGGMYNLQDRSTVMNCIFAGNISLQSGGAICNNYFSNPIITNCTLSANAADISGGGICSIDSNSIVENCILWGNTAADGNEIALAGSTIDCNYNNVKGGAAGIYVDPNSTLNWGQGNIDTDPLFVESGYWDPNSTPTDANDDFWVDGDYHLLSDSPCIDTGDPNYIVDPNEHDIDGDNRIIGGRIDIGADEYAFGELSDFNNDGIVNFKDFAILANYWMNYVCAEPNWCEGCDFDHSGLVNADDLRRFAENWLWRDK